MTGGGWPGSLASPLLNHCLRYGRTHWPMVAARISLTISLWVLSSATDMRRRFWASDSGTLT